jgi:hypothetical protein
MRHLIGIVACFGLQAVLSAQASGTAFELADDRLGGALWRIAAATRTRIGFESVDYVQLPAGLTNVPAFPVSSRDEALKVAVDADPRYEWRALGDFVVVRPKSAWNDSANPFNRPVRNLRVENGMSMDVLLGLRDFIYTNKFAVPPGSRGIPVSFEVQSGTVVDALNAFMESADTVLWIGSYRPHAQLGQRYPSWDLQLQLRGAEVLHGLSASYPPRGLK